MLAHKLLLLFTGLFSSTRAYWIPRPNTTWEITLSAPINTSSSLPPVSVLDADLFDNPARTWTYLKSRSYKTICYFSTQYESWRPDAAHFPSSTLGLPLDSWPGERWVNTNSPAIRAIMRSRIALAARAGCDAIDPDNIDAYLHAGGGGGFNLTQRDAIAYVTFLAREAHARNLSLALKNGDDVVAALVDVVDFAVVEACQANSDLAAESAYYDECGKYRPFVERGKAVFAIEYVGAEGRPSSGTVRRICGNRIARGFSTVIKRVELGVWGIACLGR